MALAWASGALEDMIAYLQEREQSGKPLVELQAVQLRLAEMQTRVDAARGLERSCSASSARSARRSCETVMTTTARSELARMSASRSSPSGTYRATATHSSTNIGSASTCRSTSNRRRPGASRSLLGPSTAGRLAASASDKPGNADLVQEL